MVLAGCACHVVACFGELDPFAALGTLFYATLSGVFGQPGWVLGRVELETSVFWLALCLAADTCGCSAFAWGSSMAVITIVEDSRVVILGALRIRKIHSNRLGSVVLAHLREIHVHKIFPKQVCEKGWWKPVSRARTARSWDLIDVGH